MPSARPPRRPPVLRPLRGIAGIGFAYGALCYGVPIAALHVLHNGLAAWWDVAWLGLELGLLYGVAGAVLVTVGALPALWLRRTRSTNDPAREEGRGSFDSLSAGDGRWQPLGPRRRSQLAGSPLRAGLFLFGVAFWVPFFLWGLTYGQIPGIDLRVAPAMAGFLALAALVIAAVVGTVSWLLDRGLRQSEEQGRLHLVLVLGVLLAVLVLVLATVGAPAPPVALAGGARSGDGAATRARAAVEADPDGVKVALVALDGLDPFVVDRLVREGAMPTLGRLLREGVYGPLETLPDSNSAVLWASIYTGLPPEQHGVLDFYRVHLPGIRRGLFPVHRTYFKEAAELLGRAGLSHRVTIARRDLAAPPLWEIADWAGLSIGVVDGYLYSFPAYPPRTAGGYFLGNALEVFAGGLIDGRSNADDLGLYVQPQSALVHTELPRGADFEWQARATLDLLRAQPQPRLLSFYCHEPDSVQHQNWRGFEPQRYFGAADEVDAMGGPITEMHRRFDAFVAELLEALEPGTVLVLISDHGHSPTLVHSMDTQHRHGPPGVFLLYGGPVREGYRYAPRPTHVYDVMPTVLYLLGLPVGRDMPGRVLEEAIDPNLLARRPVRHVASYRPLVPRPDSAAGRDERANEAELEKLRKLGYVW